MKYACIDNFLRVVRGTMPEIFLSSLTDARRLRFPLILCFVPSSPYRSQKISRKTRENEKVFPVDRSKIRSEFEQFVSCPPRSKRCSENQSQRVSETIQSILEDSLSRSHQLPRRHAQRYTLGKSNIRQTQSKNALGCHVSRKFTD